MGKRRADDRRRTNLTEAPAPQQSRSATLVGSGIFISRISGFFRDVVIANAFGLGSLMDAYAFAVRIPNFFRNLLSEGALSASFVPVLSSFLERKEKERAQRLAQGMLGFLLCLSTLVVAIGVATAPWIVETIGPGFLEEEVALTTRLVRILFPMSGIMIIGAWCLGVLTSHRHFFLPFAAPVIWNLSQIVGLLIGTRMGWGPLVVVLAWSTLIGSVLQVGIQLPSVRNLLGTVRPTIDTDFEPTRRTIRNAGPVAVGQGVFQISSLTDAAIATLLFDGAVAGLYFAQRLVLLPMALFGASVAVATLPEMSRKGNLDEIQPHLISGFQKIIYLTVPSAVVLTLFGDLITSIVYQRGQFNAESVRVVHWILAAYATGLVATSLQKLFTGVYHSVQDTRTPVKYASASVVIGILTGASFAFWMHTHGHGNRAAAGLALGGAVGAWINLGLLSIGLRRRGLPTFRHKVQGTILRVVAGAAIAGLITWPMRETLTRVLGDMLMARVLILMTVLFVGGGCYLLIAGLPQTLKRRFRKSTSNPSDSI